LYADIIDDPLETPADHFGAVSIYRERTTVGVWNFRRSLAVRELAEQSEGIGSHLCRASNKTGLLSFHNQNKVR
jgi:hypothetical protein